MNKYNFRNVPPTIFTSTKRKIKYDNYQQFCLYLIKFVVIFSYFLIQDKYIYLLLTKLISWFVFVFFFFAVAKNVVN